jgi:hypothetical protein
VAEGGGLLNLLMVSRFVAGFPGIRDFIGFLGYRAPGRS